MKDTVTLTRVYIRFCNNKTFSAILCTCSISATFFFNVFRPCHSFLDVIFCILSYDGAVCSASFYKQEWELAAQTSGLAFQRPNRLILSVYDVRQWLIPGCLPHHLLFSARR